MLVSVTTVSIVEREDIVCWLLSWMRGGRGGCVQLLGSGGGGAGGGSMPG